MNISDKGPLNDLAGLLSGLQNPGRVQSPRKETPVQQEGQDQIRISDRAKEFHEVYRLAAQAPDVRGDKVAKLKEAIDNGTYNVKGEQVANKLIAHTILDKIL
jgi:negative regulator of flagellin synthesis FlgM